MKFSIPQKCALIIGTCAAFSGAARAVDCDSVGEQVKKAVSATPAKVLVIVDEMISKNESCACEIVKSAISASEADKQLVREIVVTAVSAAQSMAATIAECAVAEAPEAASEIKAGLSEVFAGAKSGAKDVIYDDSYSAKGGKEVVVEEGEEDFGPEPVVISGVYLIAPSASSSGGVDTRELERQRRLIEILRRQVRDGRDTDRGSTTGPGPGPSPADAK